ncbi:MAG: hypothetical protein LUG99_05245 [Lachnospiraceae bacterium]|nr:hypothetical protein [Lachnospiraceae bacterium]
MGKITRWVEAVVANNHPYAPMAGTDIKKSADRLFEKEDNKKDNKENNQGNPQGNKKGEYE